MIRKAMVASNVNSVRVDGKTAKRAIVATYVRFWALVVVFEQSSFFHNSRPV